MPINSIKREKKLMSYSVEKYTNVLMSLRYYHTISHTIWIQSSITYHKYIPFYYLNDLVIDNSTFTLLKERNSYANAISFYDDTTDVNIIVHGNCFSIHLYFHALNVTRSNSRVLAMPVVITWFNSFYAMSIIKFEKETK